MMHGVGCDWTLPPRRGGGGARRVGGWGVAPAQKAYPRRLPPMKGHRLGTPRRFAGRPPPQGWARWGGAWHPCHGWPGGCRTAGGSRARGGCARRARARGRPAGGGRRPPWDQPPNAPWPAHSPVLPQHPPAGSAPTPPSDRVLEDVFEGGEEAPPPCKTGARGAARTRARPPTTSGRSSSPSSSPLSPLIAPSHVFPSTPRLGGAVAHPLGALPARRPASISPPPSPHRPSSPHCCGSPSERATVHFLSCCGKQLPPADVSAPHCRGGGGPAACPPVPSAGGRRRRTVARPHGGGPFCRGRTPQRGRGGWAHGDD